MKPIVSRNIPATAFAAVLFMALLGFHPAAASAQTVINIKDWFPLTSNSQWHYTGKGQPGSSIDDDFLWQVLTANKTITNTLGTIQARQIKTTTDDAGDDRDGSIDYWYVHTDNKFYYCGQFFAKGATGIPAQDIVLNDPLLIGGNGQHVGDIVNDTSSATFQTLLGPFTGTVTSKITYAEIIPKVLTPVGYFTNVLRLVVEIKASVVFFGTHNFDLTTSEFYLKQTKGMIKQDQDSDPNDAELQALDFIKINNVVIPPDIKNAAEFWALYP